MSKYKGRHRKATRVDKTVAKAALVGIGATSVPLTFMGGTANAATMDEWSRVAKCESGSQWHLPGGDRDSTGGLQFRVASWSDALGKLRAEGIDTSNYPSSPYQATKEQQILAGEALLALQGPRAWSVTFNGGAHCGNAAGGALSTGSVFEGGPSPFGSTPLQTIANGGKPTNSTPAPKPTTPQPKPDKPNKPAKDAPVNKGAEKSNKATYTVVSGDTLYDIAIAHNVGDGGLDTWKPLYSANKKVVGDNPHYILPGQVLHIPGGKPETPAKSEDKKEQSTDSVEYTVRKGDTLSYLAQYYYGDAKEYPRIFEANRPPLHSDPNALEVGMKLTIPGTSKKAPPVREVKDSAPVVNNSGYVLPIAKGQYRVGQSIINSGGCVSRSCGGHSGLDLSAPSGTQVKAIAAGTVVHAGYGGAGAAYGDHVIIKHNDGRYTLYGHMSSHNVSKGQTVSAGRWIGNVGSTGNSSGPHLHFEVRTSATSFSPGVFINPVSYLRDHGVTL